MLQTASKQLPCDELDSQTYVARPEMSSAVNGSRYVALQCTALTTVEFVIVETLCAKSRRTGAEFSGS